MVSWPADRYGEFHTGDSYIVLNVSHAPAVFSNNTQLSLDIVYTLPCFQIDQNQDVVSITKEILGDSSHCMSYCEWLEHCVTKQ